MNTTPARVAVMVAMLVALVPIVRAQAPPVSAAADVSAIRKLLQSEVLSEQAWGAWFAGQTQRRELIPDLLNIGSASQAAADRPRQALVDVVLDALIQLEARPEPSWSIRFFEHRPTQSLILLAKAGDGATPVLLDLARTQKGIRWLTPANLLMSRRAAGFAAVLLEGLTIHGDLHVTNSADQAFVVGGTDASASDGIGSPPPGFPPSTHYYLTLGDYHGAIVVAPGRQTVRTIYYMRGVYAPGQQYPASWSDRTAPTSQDRLDYIAALRGSTAGSHALRANESKTIVWKTGMNLDKEAAAYQAELTRRYESLVRELVREKLLTDDEAKTLPAAAINVLVHDKR